MQHLGSQAGQFQHLVIGDFLDLPGPLNRAGVGGEHPVHIRVDLAQLRPQGSGQGYGGGV